MRTSAAALSIVLLAGCDSSDPVPPVFGGFEPQEQAAVIFAPTPCVLPGVGSVSISGVGVYFTDYVGTCDVLSLVPQMGCGSRESSVFVLGLALSGVAGGVEQVGATGPGTYPMLRSPPTTATFVAGTGDAEQAGPACDPREDLDLIGGQVVLASVSTEAVTGSVDFRFTDRTTFQHAIDATVCPISADLCDYYQPFCWDGYACVPAAP